MQKNLARVKRISHAIETYLEQRTKHETRITEHQREFETGKRHLANIMGRDPQSEMSQEDVDRAIEYLFPSGLLDKRARPMMKPPEEIFPKFPLLEFEHGRPKHTLFYTGCPKFYGTLSEINRISQQLVHIHDDGQAKTEAASRGKRTALRRELTVDDEEDTTADEGIAQKSGGALVKREWVSHKQLSGFYQSENITEDMHASLILALEYLTSLPNSHQHKELIERFQLKVGGGKELMVEPIWRYEIPEVRLEPETGRRFATINVRVKGTSSTVTTLADGTGDITIDGYHYSQLRSLLAREILLSPMVVTDMLGKVDVSAVVTETYGGNTICPSNRRDGHIVLPRSVRNGIALGMAALYPEYKETLRLAGLLSFDIRRSEREKISQKGPRAKWRWKRR